MKIKEIPLRFRRRRDGLVKMEAALAAVVHWADGSIEDLGVISRRVVTDAFVALLVDDLQGSQSAFHTMKYHGAGTGTNAESAGDTALQTEVGTRATGTQTEGGSANIYQTVATWSFDTTRAITEHGVFSASTGGTLLDRSVFAAINGGSGDSIQFTYSLTVTAGG
jgi:hypothetical protein